MENKTRQSGVLLHITSLPNEYGLGTFSNACERTIEFLSNGGFKVWQVLPFNDCGYAKSPYSAVSVFAINPYFLDISRYLDINEVASLQLNRANIDKYIEAEKIDKAHEMIYQKNKDKYDYKAFCTKESYWLDDYALFKTLKHIDDKVAWSEWPEKIKKRDKVTLDGIRQQYALEIDKHKFIQFLLYERWQEIRRYAKERNVEIFGDMPMYVEFDSADVWSNPKNWKLDKGKPTLVAGVPPDYFCKEGQRWGNPIYDYDYMKTKKYDFWLKRFQKSAELYDIIRIDHFIAFARYWAIPSTAKTATKGKWVKGAGDEVLKLVTSKVKVKIVAEDLGVVGQDVDALREKYNIPGLKVMQFAFDGEGDNMYQPHNFEKNTVAYIGTHDNDTYMGLLNEGHWDKINRIKRYLGMPLEEGNDRVIDNTILALYRSSANMIILTAQDLLKLGTDARMNIPGSTENNWLWQLSRTLDLGMCGYYRELAKIYAR